MTETGSSLDEQQTPREPYFQPLLARLRKWEETYKPSEENNRKLLGDLISKGVAIENFLMDTHDPNLGWRPSVFRIGHDEESRVLIAFTTPQSIRFGVETFEAGEKAAVQTSEGWGGSQEYSLSMIPYLRFTKDGKIDPRETEILLLNYKQRHHIDQLIHDFRETEEGTKISSED